MTTTHEPTSATDQAPAVGRRQRRSGGGMPWPDARTRAGTAARPLAARWLPLQEASGCLLVSDLLALTDLPAGRLLEHRLFDGQCARIATGAVVPDGADAMLKVECSLRDAIWVRPSDPAHQEDGGGVWRDDEERYRYPALWRPNSFGDVRHGTTVHYGDLDPGHHAAGQARAN